MIEFLLALVIRILILCALVYGIIVLIEHGPGGFVSGLGTEWKALEVFFRGIPAQFTSGS